jgi:plasmid stability protein
MVAFRNPGYSMASITLKNIPDDLYKRLAEIARRHRRSLSKELIVALEAYVRRPESDKHTLRDRIRAVRERYPATISEADIQGWKDTGRP